jgi:GMP synthase-like glutamine amidotransferase
MRVHWLQHVPFENLGSIEPWVINHGYALTSTHLFAGDALPSMDRFDVLVIMGGPMSVHDDDKYPWLNSEKHYIKAAIDSGKMVLGICLGAQLIAQVLGAKVYKNAEKEIGWHPIRIAAPQDEKSALFGLMSDQTSVFHWHGETFDLPDNARHLALSEACQQQAFSYKKTVLALQCHLEITEQGITRLIENCSHEIVPAPFIQSRNEMLSGLNSCDQNQQIMEGILDRLVLENV